MHEQKQTSEDSGYPKGPSFVPYPLQLKGKPELQVFPQNVMFAKYGHRDGQPIVGSALYEPALETISSRDGTKSMRYTNVYGGDAFLVISFDEHRRVWSGTKTVNGKLIGSATGSNWDRFFTQFGLLSLTNGESCSFLEIP